MKIFHPKKLYLPALSIVAVVVLLLILISISTFRNLDREKTRALHFLHRQGVALLKSIEASARTGMESLMWQEISLGKLLQETAKDEEIDFVYLIDNNGLIAHHSEPSKEGKVAAWKPAFLHRGGLWPTWILLSRFLVTVAILSSWKMMRRWILITGPEQQAA